MENKYFFDLWNKLLPLVKNEYGKNVQNIQLESDKKVVTNLDLSLSKFLKGFIKKHISSDYVVISEESYNLKKNSDKKIVFIDPIDNTISLISGFHDHTISLGVKKYNKFISGLVYVPDRDESYMVDYQGKAVCNGALIQPFTKTIDQKLRGIGTCSYIREENISKALNFYKKLLLRKIPLRINGGAALHLCEVATGQLFGYVSFGAHLWDIAGGLAILKASGGFYKLYSPNLEKLTVGCIAAGTKKNLLLLENLSDMK